MKKKLYICRRNTNQEKMAKKSNLSYAEAMAEIERTLQRFRSEELSVDELAEKVKHTSALIAECRARLKKAEEEIAHILEE